MGFGGIPIQRIDARGTRALMERLVEKGVNYIDLSLIHISISTRKVRANFLTFIFFITDTPFCRKAALC